MVPIKCGVKSIHKWNIESEKKNTMCELTVDISHLQHPTVYPVIVSSIYLHYYLLTTTFILLDSKSSKEPIGFKMVFSFSLFVSEP